MFGILHLPIYLVGTVAIILLPGPNSLFCLATAARYGSRAGLAAMLGIFIGDAFLMLLVALGAASILSTHPALFAAVKICGGFYLSYIGIKLIISAYQSWHSNQLNSQNKNAIIDNTAMPTRHPIGHDFWHALLLSLSNPKAILFYLAFFTQFVDPSYPHPLISFLMLGIILETISVLYLTFLIFIGAKLALKLAAFRKTSATAMGSIGALFVGFAVKLWIA